MTSAHDFGDFDVHPAAELFPLMSESELDELAADIKANGLRNLIVVLDGKILDGRNRYLACRRAGVLPVTEEYTGKTSPLTWIVSQNLCRRHLTESQRAMLGTKLVPLLEHEAKERQRAGGRDKVPAKLPDAGETRAKAAELSGVSARTMQDAITVERRGPPELAEAVAKGEVSVSAAAKAVRTGDTRASPARRRRGRVAPARSWSVPWSIDLLAAEIRRKRTPQDIDQLVRLLRAPGPDAVDSAKHVPTSTGSASA